MNEKVQFVNNVPLFTEKSDEPQMKRNIKASLITLGIVSIICAILGLLYNMLTLWTSFSGAFEKLTKEQNLTYFYPSFYAMSGICVVFYILLIFCGIYFLRLQIRYAYIFVATLVCEVLYFVSLKFALWNLKHATLSIAAGTGVANGGLMAQYFILFPVWGIVLTLWIKKKIEKELITGSTAD
jgi:glucan phosphoethanolaminetransferase (alkaline phosphatase superfamily)